MFIIETEEKGRDFILEVISLYERSKASQLTPAVEEVPYLNRAEASDFLKISLPTLHQYTKDGTITCHRIGSRVLYKKSDLLNICKSANIKKNKNQSSKFYGN
jgi:excisionase family DNA binding protein